MRRQPMFGLGIAPRRPVAAELNNKNVLGGRCFIVGHAVENLLPDLERHQFGGNENAGSFAINPKGSGTLIDQALNVFHIFLRERCVFFRGGNQHQVVAFFPLRALAAKRVISHGRSCRNSFVTGISELTRSGLTDLMHRHSPSHPRTPGVIAHQSKVHAFDVIVGRVLKSPVRQGRRFFKEGVTYFFAHGGIVRGIRGKFHSVFPVVVFVHSCNVNAAAN